MTTQTRITGRTGATSGQASLNGQRQPLQRPPGASSRSRRTGAWFGLLLLLMGAVVGATWMWQHKAERVEVLVVRDPVPAGAVVEAGDLTTADVGGLASAVPLNQLEQVVGRTAAVGLVPGQVMVEGMLTSATVPGPGERVVGLDLEAGRVAPGLVVGDRVRVLLVPAAGEPGSSSQMAAPPVLSEEAMVRFAGRSLGATTRLGLVVPDVDADAVAAYGAAGRVAVVQVPLLVEPGASDGDLTGGGEG